MKEDLNILLTENDHVAKNRSTLITLNESDDEKIRRQSIALRHKTTNAMKLTAMISHQFNVVRASQQCYDPSYAPMLVAMLVAMLMTIAGRSPLGYRVVPRPTLFRVSLCSPESYR